MIYIVAMLTCIPSYGLSLGLLILYFCIESHCDKKNIESLILKSYHLNKVILFQKNNPSFTQVKRYCECFGYELCGSEFAATYLLEVNKVKLNLYVDGKGLIVKNRAQEIFR